MLDNLSPLSEKTAPAQGSTHASRPSAEAPLDLTIWEPVTDPTVFPGHPTPFTWSVLAPTLTEGYRRTFSQFNLPWPETGDVFCVQWGQPYRRRSIALDAAGEDPARGGRLAQGGSVQRGNKTTEAILAAAADTITRAQRWYGRVQQTRWGQADLLQVMEEIENLGNSLQAAWVQLGIILVAANTRLQQWQREVWPNAGPSQVADLTGHVATYAEMLARASTAQHSGSLAELVSTFGFRAANELELSTRRWSEAPPSHSTVWPATIGPAWVGFAARQRAAEQALAGHVGFLKRRGFEADLQWRRRVADLFDQVDEARARWLAGTRIWAIAAAQESAADGRIAQVDDIFLLELEEVKQLMTGEWNVTHRESLQELVAERQQDFTRWQSHP